MSIPQATTSFPPTGRLARAIEDRSNGRLRVEIYPSSQLAGERESVDGLTSGTVDLTIQTNVFLESLFPRLQVLDLPFMFRDADAMYRVVNGPIGDELFADFEAKGIVGLVWGGAGFREIETSSKPVAGLGDVKGLRLRIQNGPIFVSMMQALGAVPVPIDFSETFTALQQHTVDGMEITLDQVVTQKFYTVIRHVALSNHVFSMSPLIGSKRKIESLPADLQRILKTECKDFGPAWRQAIVQRNEETVQALRSQGVAITSIDYPAFRKAMDPVYASVASKIGSDLIDRAGKAAYGK